jgi:hypothetical protein
METPFRTSTRFPFPHPPRLPLIFPMKSLPATALLTLALALPLVGEVLRISRAYETPQPGTTAFELVTGDSTRTLHVVDSPILTSADVLEAFPSPTSENTIAITLNPAGEAKLKAATAEPAGMFLAIFLDGELVLAPGVRSTLGKNIAINGLDPAEVELHALRISGKTEAAARDLLAQRAPRAARAAPPPPVYHTDEEYGELKAAREKSKVFYLDELPTQDHLHQTLTPGMSPDEVIALHGPASRFKNNPDGSPAYFDYELAPEKAPENRAMSPRSFRVSFSEGKLTTAKIDRYSTTPRAPKSEPEPPPPARIVFPEMDLRDADLDFTKLIEGITLRGDPKRLSTTEALYLLGLISIVPQDSGDTLGTACPVVVALAAHFPEAARLVAASSAGTIPAGALAKVLQPYTFAELDLPATLAPN